MKVLYYMTRSFFHVSDAKLLVRAIVPENGYSKSEIQDLSEELALLAAD